MGTNITTSQAVTGERLSGCTHCAAHIDRCRALPGESQCCVLCEHKPIPATPDEQRRAGFIAGLRALADRLDANPDIPQLWRLPHGLPIYASTVEQATAAIEMLEDPTLDIDPGSTYYKVHVDGHLAGLNLRVYVHDSVGLVDPPAPVEPVVNPALLEAVQP
jgi:hypothetical protein